MQMLDRAAALAYIKENVSCRQYLGPRTGARNHYCCPACGSGTGPHHSGALKYYAATNSTYCHACHKSFDVIDLYMISQGVDDFNTALYDLAAIAGVEIVKGSGPVSIESNLPKDFTEYYSRCAERLEDPAAVSYLQGRGISLATAKEYQLGYDPEADPANAPGDISDRKRPHPVPRIIIPCSRSHYVARSIDPDTPPEYKKMNPSQNKGAGSVSIFNRHLLRSEAETVFITEGIFDALSIIEAGYDAIALNSASNRDKLLEDLRKKPTNAKLVICLDNDTAGSKAAADLSAGLQALGVSFLSENLSGSFKDPNEALTGDRAAFFKAVKTAAEKVQRLAEKTDELGQFMEKIQTVAYMPCSTGLRFFDNLLGGGVMQQSLVLLMAAPGTGKTTLAAQLGETMAEHGKPVIYFNFEMSREQMLAKALSAKLYRAGINMTALEILQGYKWSGTQIEAMERILPQYRKENYPFIKYNPAGSSSELSELLDFLRATGEAAKASRRQAPAAIVDYLHLINSRSGLDNQELIKQAVTGLKQYAIDCDTFVIGIIASNRISNKDGRLTLESGRDSSALEYSGDIVLSLNYAAIDSGKVKTDDLEAVANLQQATRREMIIRVLKNRFGQQGRSAQVLFDAGHNIFYGREDRYQNDGWTLDDGSAAFKGSGPAKWI